jgi:DNA-binding MarR family transcriptional regulator
MRLEDEIRQVKGFSSERQKALVNILFTHSWITERFREHLTPFGLTQQQYNVLRILRGSLPEPMSTSCIRVRMIDKMSDVSRIVDRLCKKELVVRIQSPVDRRLVDVRISEKGLHLLSKMDEERLDRNTIVNLNDQELIQLNQLLDKLRG